MCKSVCVCCFLSPCKQLIEQQKQCDNTQSTTRLQLQSQPTKVALINASVNDNGQGEAKGIGQGKRKGEVCVNASERVPVILA